MGSFTQSTEKYCSRIWLSLRTLTENCIMKPFQDLYSKLYSFLRGICIIVASFMMNNVDCLMLVSLSWYYRMLQEILVSSINFLGKCSLHMSWQLLPLNCSCKDKTMDNILSGLFLLFKKPLLLFIAPIKGCLAFPVSLIVLVGKVRLFLALWLGKTEQKAVV